MKLEHRITAWSYSRAADYRECPRRAYYKHAGPADARPVVPEERSPSADRGTRLHAEAERYLRDGTPLEDPVWFGWTKEMASIRDQRYAPERKLVFDRRWRLLDDWHHPSTWLRMALDASRPCRDFHAVIDFKSGREYPAHIEQAELYALGVMRADEADEVRVEFWYLDSCDIAEYQFTASGDYDRLCEKWDGLGRRITSDRKFEPTPGRACTAYGRPCPFGPEVLKLCPGK